jgi:hypothetical protein
LRDAWGSHVVQVTTLLSGVDIPASKAAAAEAALMQRDVEQQANTVRQVRAGRCRGGGGLTCLEENGSGGERYTQAFNALFELF